MITESSLNSVNVEWAAKYIQLMLEQSTNGRLQEVDVFSKLSPPIASPSINSELIKLNRWFFSADRRHRVKWVNSAIRWLIRSGNLTVVRRYKGRDEYLMGPGEDTRVFEAGGVLDKLAVIATGESSQ